MMMVKNVTFYVYVRVRLHIVLASIQHRHKIQYTDKKRIVLILSHHIDDVPVQQPKKAVSPVIYFTLYIALMFCIYFEWQIPENRHFA